MAEWTTIQAEDGHRLDLYIARPASPPIAGLVVLQEIFGVNAHIRSIADAFAQDGFLAVAPALFDRIEKSIQLGYEGADRDRAMACLKQMNPSNAIKDVAATLAYARQVTGKKPASSATAGVGSSPGYLPHACNQTLRLPTMPAASATSPKKPRRPRAASLRPSRHAHPDRTSKQGRQCTPRS